MKQKKEYLLKTKDNTAITLIALVITIIVLLILAIVSINLVINGGIIGKTEETVFKTEIEQYNEELKISIAADQTEKLGYRTEKFNVRRSSYDNANTFTEVMKEKIPSFDQKYADKLEIKEDTLTYIGEEEKERTWLAQTISIAGMLKISYVYENGTEAAPTYQKVITDGSCEVESPKIEGYEPDHYIVEGTADKDTDVTVTYYGESQGLDYELLDDGTYTVSGIGTFTGEGLVIPREHNGKRVKEIKQRAFYLNKTIKKIIVQDNIYKINSECFAFMSKLESIYVNCNIVSSNSTYGGILRKVVIGENVEEINGWGFRNSEDLNDLTIFSEKININGSQFVNSDIENIKINKENSKYKVIDGVLYSKDGKKIYMYPPAKKGNFVIPDFVEELGPFSFYYNKYLSEISIPNTVNSVGTQSFESCKNISIINVDAKNIGGSVFYSIPNLHKVIIGTNVNLISGWAFRNNNNLKEIEFIGTKSEWNAINKANDWRVNDNVEKIECSDGTIDL